MPRFYFLPQTGSRFHVLESACHFKIYRGQATKEMCGDAKPLELRAQRDRAETASTVLCLSPMQNNLAALRLGGNSEFPRQQPEQRIDVIGAEHSAHP